MPRRSRRCCWLLALALLPGLSLAAPAPPTAKEAEAFLADAEKKLLELWIAGERAGWVQSNFITDDTERIAADAHQAVIAATMDLAAQATRFDGVQLPAELTRKLKMIKTSLSLVAPRDEAKQAELSRIAAAMEGLYGKGKYCPQGEGSCRDLEQLSKTLATSRNPDELLEAWRGWRTISPPLRPMYQRFAELANAGARDLGFHDLGELWRAGYDMPPQAFSTEVDRLWTQVRPLYESLHCYVRARLREAYGPAIVPERGPIPAHLLGNMWSQEWGNIYPLVAPPEVAASYDLTALLKSKNVDPKEMVRYGERFFTSLGFEPLPESFWERSLFVKPADREVVCHASAWDIDFVNDLRIKMCIDITDEDFVTIHHELGHNFYQRAYDKLSPLYRQGANDGFHEGIGDTIALSITPEYLVKVGLLDKAPPADADLGLLMRMALEKVAFLPFGLMVDQWRWKVFSGEIPPERYNAAWWELAEKYQGIRPPVSRSEADFDPGAKYHVPANTPYTRYFLADILQFQFHRALCQAAGYSGPLNRCSIYANAEAGKRLRAMLEMGASQPWPDELAAITGQRQMDATAILDYFAPLKAWLDQQNKGRVCGW
ncbi:MAG TPA: M2 family metallopeptidase [Candidatus Polarisedimenticolaceae bacterium]|nr:M2 family metallopeptidase [Candidatus Polarisedimenticolaceae bacterium]